MHLWGIELVMQLIRRRPRIVFAALAIAVLSLAACFDKGSYKGGGRITQGAKEGADAGQPEQPEFEDLGDDDDDTPPANPATVDPTLE